jgi:hypothetical protein
MRVGGTQETGFKGAIALLPMWNRLPSAAEITFRLGNHRDLGDQTNDIVGGFAECGFVLFHPVSRLATLQLAIALDIGVGVEIPGLPQTIAVGQCLGIVGLIRQFPTWEI